MDYDLTELHIDLDAIESNYRNICRQAKIPVMAVVKADAYGHGAVPVARLLEKQIESPVQWENIIRNMIASGIDTFIEIGPGKTLTNIIKKIDLTVKAYTFAEYLEETLC